MRTVPRSPTNLGVVVESGGSICQGTITNLSLQGAFIALPSPVPTSPFVILRFSLPHSRRPLELDARVVRTTPEGIGVEFLNLDPRQQKQLWSLLGVKRPKAREERPDRGHPLNSQGQGPNPPAPPSFDHPQEDFLTMQTEDSQTSREMIGTCPAMHRVFSLIRKVATIDMPVLITGASGTGKEMVAQAIHERSLRAQRPFVAVNCGAIPRELLESELFGHEKGAFTGAYRTVVGKVELANQGTLFLDEIGELPLELQVKLLRFLQEYSFERVGGRQTIQVDLRVISATNTGLKELIAAGRYREDLYYRLNVVNVDLPQLKDRGDDVLLMANIFLKRYSVQIGKEIRGLTPDALRAIQAHSWPGNIRELINHIRRAVVLAEDSWVTPENLGLELVVVEDEPINGLGLKEAKAQFEANLVAETLAKAGGNVQLVAQTLKTSRSVIYHLINKYGLAA